MKYLKVIGIAAIAAMGLIAFVGAGTASATVLCTTTDTPTCTMAYGVGTEIHASLKSGTSAKLWEDPKGPEPLVTCSESTVRGSTTNAGSSTDTVSARLDTTLQVDSQHTGLHWGGCNHTTDTLTTNINNVQSIGELEIHYISGTHNGTVTSRNTDVTTVIGGVSCTYGSGAGLDLGELESGAVPTLSITATVNKVAGSFVCPPHAIWEAEYVITSPHALYVTTS